MKKLIELSLEELEALSLAEFTKKIVEEVTERWASYNNAPIDTCIPYVEGNSIALVYDNGAIYILEANGGYLLPGEPIDILNHDLRVLSQIFSTRVGPCYGRTKQEWELKGNAERDAKIEEEERAKYKLLHARYGKGEWDGKW